VIWSALLLRNWLALLSLAVTIVLVALGLLCVVRLMFLPRHRGGYPRCGACGYPAVGLPEPRCPGCGASLVGPGAVRSDPFHVRGWLLRAAVWGVVVLSAALALPVDEFESTVTISLSRQHPTHRAAPELYLEGSTNRWRVWFLRYARADLRLSCEDLAGRNRQPMTSAPTWDRRDVLVLRPPGAWTTRDPAGELVTWYARHAGTLTPDEAGDLWGWLSGCEA
jgi:hypothetical protein